MTNEKPMFDAEQQNELMELVANIAANPNRDGMAFVVLYLDQDGKEVSVSRGPKMMISYLALGLLQNLLVPED